MSAVASGRVEVLRPPKRGLINNLKAAAGQFLVDHLDIVFRVLRVVRPIWQVGRWVIVTRNDDVREVLLDNDHFHVEQTKRLSREMDHVPFMLGEDDRAVFKRIEAPLRAAMKSDDIPGLARRCGERVAELARQSGGRLEVVDVVRLVTFDVFSDYIGVKAPKEFDLRIAATRIYEFQVSPFKDEQLSREAMKYAKALRSHIDGLVASAKADGSPKNDVLHRLLAQQARDPGEPSDEEIRANLFGLIVALVQLPIAAPEALNQLFERPAELDAAVASVGANDDTTLAAYLFEGLRFDPMAPFLLRTCAETREIASGARRAKTITKGKVVVAALQSAMKDPRRLAAPEVFDPRRPWSAYLIFGDGLHVCFAEQINRQVMPALLKPLLACEGFAREQGDRGKLRKRAFMPDQLWVTFKPPPASALVERGPARLEPAPA